MTAGTLLQEQEQIDAQGMESDGSARPLNSGLPELSRIRKIRFEIDHLNHSAQLVAYPSAEDIPQTRINFGQIDTQYLFPCLPYKHSGQLDEFDAVNLKLVEQSSVDVVFRTKGKNRSIAAFRHSANSTCYPIELNNFNGGFRAFPARTRFGLTRNRLMPGLWELSSVDSCGGKFHVWFSMPMRQYYQKIRELNDLEASIFEVRDTLRHVNSRRRVEPDLGRLRIRMHQLHSTSIHPKLEKSMTIHGFQDFKWKARRSFHDIVSHGEILTARSLVAQEKGGQYCRMGLLSSCAYEDDSDKYTEPDSDWTSASIYEVRPRTLFKGQKAGSEKSGHIELVVNSRDGNRSLVIGNIPLDRLASQRQYVIYGLGVGVRPSSGADGHCEAREINGPRPDYAYVMKKTAGRWELVNNLEAGIEQVYLNLFDRDGQKVLRMIVLPNERAVNPGQFEIPLNSNLADRFQSADSNKPHFISQQQ